MEVNFERANEIIKAEIQNNDIVLFMKGSKDVPMCGFSAAVVQVLQNLGVADFKDIDVLQDFDIREGIKKYSDWPTIPQLYIKENFIGGCDIVKDMYGSGQLLELLQKEKLA